MSSINTCPICRQPNTPDNHLCWSCGADLNDPDVIAMAPGDSTEMPQSSLGEAGALAEDRFLKVSLAGLASGAALRKLAAIGGGFLLLGFLFPTSADFRGWLWLHHAVADGPSFAVLFPLLAAITGLTLAFLPRLENWIRAAILTGVGLVGVFFCLPQLGKYAGAPFKILPVSTLGLLIAGSAVIARIYHPRLRQLRYILIGGAALTLIGLLIPLGKAYDGLAAEYPLYINDRFADMSLATAYSKGVRHDMMVRMLSLYGLLPFILLPLTAAVAWPTPRGVWDKTGVALRPMAWLTALYIPLTFALLVFNVAGWSESEWVRSRGHVVSFDDFTEALLVGRARLFIISSFLVLWIQLGAVALYDHFRPAEAPPPEK